MFGEWHEIKKEGLPKEKGYYLVAIERTNGQQKKNIMKLITYSLGVKLHGLQVVVI